MKTRTVPTWMNRLPVLAGAMALTALAMASDAVTLQVRNGVVKFDATTNLSAISVHGQSNAITADLTLHKAGNGVEVENLRAVVAPKTLTTGMSLRDQHMRKKIFATNTEQLPELEFVSAKSNCPVLPPSQEVVCQISGNLSLRGVAKPFSMSLKIRNDGSKYRVNGEGIVKLSGYGIEAPCQLGVCVTDEVKLRLELQAQETLMRSGGIR